MSDGIRSGVNWMRLNFRSTASASFLISSVLARPGHAAEQAVAAGQEGNQDLADDALLADDDLRELPLEPRRELGDALERIGGSRSVSLEAAFGMRDRALPRAARSRPDRDPPSGRHACGH